MILKEIAEVISESLISLRVLKKVYMFAHNFMNPKRKIYHYLFYLLPVVYVFSFLFSPYFHHHAEELLHNDSHKFHSHLFEDSGDDHSSEETHSHNLEESSQHHFHFVKLSRSTIITTKKVTETWRSVTFLDYTILSEKPTYNYYTIEKKPKNSIQQDRCVQTATNVSPPLA